MALAHGPGSESRRVLPHIFSLAPLVWPRIAESLATRPPHFLMQLRNKQILAPYLRATRQYKPAERVHLTLSLLCVY